MAKFDMGKGLDDYRARLVTLDKDMIGIIKYAVYPAAALVIENIKANTPVDSGDLRDSAKLSNFETKDGFTYTAVYFTGYDSNRVPNPIKARVLESGSSTREKKPFIRPALNKSKKQAIEIMRKHFDEKVNDKMK